MKHNGKARLRSTRRRELAALVAAGLPLQHILRHLCSALAEDDSPDVIRQLTDIMCISTRFRRTLLECGGLVPLPKVLLDSSEKAQQFATWLSKYGMLCSSMHITTPYNCDSGPRFDSAQLAAVEQAISSALATAAEVAPQGLQLRSCTLDCVDRHCAYILQQLPCNHLTGLQLTVDEHGQEEADAESVADAFFTGIAAAMSQLTALRSLDLSSTNAIENLVLDPLLQPLSALTNLTGLSIARLAGYQDMRYLPTSLSRLYFELAIERGDPSNLNLQHLTAVTYLATDEYTQMHGNYILPPNLKRLYVGSVQAAGCLLPLKQLEELRVDFETADGMSAADLQQLSSLTGLQDVTFSFEFDWVFNAAAAGFPFVPGLRRLHLRPVAGELTLDVLQPLSKLKQLSALGLRTCEIAVMPSSFRAILQQMTALTSLDLTATKWQVGSPLDDTDAASRALLPLVVIRGMSKLQRLKALVVDQMNIGRGAAAAVAQLTQLRVLHVNDCGLEDCSLLHIVTGLSRTLVGMNFRDNQAVTDAVLPVLQWLRPDLCNEYAFSGTSVTREGLDFYLNLG